MLDAFKLDEDSLKSVVIRMHENIGTESRNKIEFAFPITKPEQVNILEEPIGDWELVSKDSVPDAPTILKSDQKQVYHSIKPFQILTLKMDPVY